MLWFRVPFRGNPLVLLLGASLFLACTLGMGLLISTLCKTQQQAFASSFFVLMPVFMLSGFSFPIASMPTVLQWLTYLNPLRYFLVVLRGTFLKGVGLARALAADARDGSDRRDGAERERIPLSEVARLKGGKRNAAPDSRSRRRLTLIGTQHYDSESWI